MKCGHGKAAAAGPSGIIDEMLKAAGEEGVELVRKLAEVVFSNLYKGKGETLDHGNYCGLKRTDQVMKLLERVLDSSIHQMVNIDEMQFTFVSGRGTIDAIFIIHQLQEKYIAAPNERLYFALFRSCAKKGPVVGLEEPGCGWMDCACHPDNAWSHVRVNGQYSAEFGMGFDVYQGFVLSPLHFILVLKALSCKFRTGVAWKLLYADDLVLSVDTQKSVSPSSRHGRLV